MHNFSLLSRLFSLLLVFKCLIMMCLDMEFWSLFCLGFTQSLGPTGLCLSPKLISFGPYFFKYFFNPALLLLSFCDLNDRGVNYLLLFTDISSSPPEKNPSTQTIYK